MPRHARAIIAAARKEIQETNAADPLGSLWTDAELLEWANEGQDQASAEIIGINEDFFGDFFEINTTASVSIYDLPSRLVKMRRVDYLVGGAEIPVPESQIRAEDSSIVLGPISESGFAYTLFSDQIHFRSAAAMPAATPAFRCWFNGDPAELTYGKASAGGSTSITLQAADAAGPPQTFGASGEDDYYNGTWIALTAGVGAGQRRRIADYVGSTKVATVSPAWTSNPDATSEYATETKVPSPVWRMVHLFAAIAAKQKYKQDARALVARFNALHESIPQALHRRTSTERAHQPFDPEDGLYG